jgi:hypothetical protein
VYRHDSLRWPVPTIREKAATVGCLTSELLLRKGLLPILSETFYEMF